MDLEDLEYVMGTLKLLGPRELPEHRQFLELFEGDQETIDKIDPMIAERWDSRTAIRYPDRPIPVK